MDKETSAFKLIGNPLQLIGYLFRFRLKEILAVIVLILIGTILILNVGYSKKDGFSWRPAADIHVEVKK